MFKLKNVAPLFLTILLLACPNTTPSETPLETLLDVTGQWLIEDRRSSTSGVDQAVATLNQATQGTDFAGLLRSALSSTNRASISGDVQTGQFRITENSGTFYTDVSGKFSPTDFSGTYKTYSKFTNTTATGIINMIKVTATSKLTVNIQPTENVAAPVTISDGKTRIYSFPITNETVLELPKTKLTITSEDVEPYLAPAAQTVDLTNGDQTITLKYRLRPIRLVVPSTLEVNRNNQAVLKAQILPAPDFQGVVELRLQNLPAGVTATPVSVNVIGGTVFGADIPVFAAADTKFVDTQVTLTAVSSAESASANVTIQTRPKLTFPLPTIASWEMGADGQMYVHLPAERSIFRVNQDGSRELIVTGDFPCGGLYAAPDGSLWTSHRGFTRIDVNAKAFEILDNPTGGSGCGSLLPDANKKIWDVFGQVVRYDLVSQQKTTVPDSQNLGFIPSKIVNNQLWGALGSNLGMINTTTLEIKKYQIPGAFNVNAFYVHDNMVALGDGTKLFVLNTSTGAIVEHQPEGITGFSYLMGQEQDGSLWIAGFGKWVRYNPITKQITKELPALSSTKVYVTPTGKLWYVTTAGLFFIDP
jgi:hypothetical protein